MLKPPSITVVLRTLTLFLPIIIVMLAVSSPVAAAIHRCTIEEGRVVFQDKPCPVSQPVKQSSPAGRLRGSEDQAPPGGQRIPAGMDPSWFVRPPAATGLARCTDLACECDSQPYPLVGDRVQAVAQALYIDGNWHRYQQLADAAADVSTDAAGRPMMQAAKLARAACEVMVAQIILLDGTAAVLRDLRNRLALGRARGFDQSGRCTGAGQAACRYQEDLQRYRMILDDIEALRLPRVP